jgi:glyoxylase-like metal-dependent hydrolase (beta-lactamase superfamily II)
MLSRIQIPKSSSTINVSVIDNGSFLTNMRGADYMSPVLPGYESFDGPSYVFLLHHEPTNTRLLFDLGIRVDWQTATPPDLLKMFEEIGMGMRVDQDITELLAEHGISPSSVDTVIFSHNHDDHTGDTTKFPSSTRIVVGPGYKEAYLPGYPKDLDSIDTMSDLYEGRETTEIDFSSSDAKVCTIGGFKAYDYFSDGSFYLLSTPGHTIGHLSALARTASDGQESTFIILGGDIVSSSGVFRPSEGNPLPDQVPTMIEHHFCPGELLAKLHRHHATDKGRGVTRRTPFCAVAGEEEDLAESQRNAEKLSVFDDEEDIFVVWAHDLHLQDVIEFFPAQANDWKAKGWKEKVHWRWLDPCVKAVSGPKSNLESISRRA